MTAAQRREYGSGDMIPRWLCRLTLRHRGQVGYILDSGPFWMCDRCGAIVR